jgi:hypothetical protein
MLIIVTEIHFWYSEQTTPQGVGVILKDIRSDQSSEKE